MGALSSLKQLFARASPPEIQLSNPFLQLDTAAAARELCLVERGTDNGARDLPRTQANAFDPVEREIIDRVSGVARQAQQEVAAQFQAYDERIAGLGLLAQIPVISVAAMQAVSEMRAAVVQANLRLTTARDNVSQSYAQLRAFQAEHGLRRPAQLDKPFIATTGAIILTWVLETFINSLLLRQNDDMGLLGGIFSAAVVGALNVGTAAFVGRMIWPLICLKRIWIRAFAIVLTAGWVVIGFAWNLLAANYRDSKVAGLPHPEITALSMFGAPPESIYSWGLFLAGTLFSVVAAAAAFRMDDPYPGYGPVSREHQSRCDDYAGEVEDAAADLTEIRDNATAEVTDIRRELATQLADRDRALNGRNAFVQRYDHFQSELENAANQLLATYRDANLQARSTPGPAYFDETFRLPRSVIPPAPSLQITPLQVEHADRALVAAVEQMSAAYLEGIQQFETLESLKARLPHG